MNDVVTEARWMPDAAVAFARGVSFVRTPEHLVPLRTRVREKRHADLIVVHTALAERFNHTGADYLNVFRAAAEMAVMERVGRNELTIGDRQTLRQLWNALLNAT